MAGKLAVLWCWGYLQHEWVVNVSANRKFAKRIDWAMLVLEEFGYFWTDAN